MLTQTSLTAIRALLHLVQRGEEAQPISPRVLAVAIEASPTYMAKITGLLVKADILRAHHGAHGGVILSRATKDISLLSIIEACQGTVLADYCQECHTPELVCAYHLVMMELHDSIVSVLSRWTLADLAAKPAPSPPLLGQVSCRICGNHVKE